MNTLNSHIFFRFSEVGLKEESTKIYIHMVTPIILPLNFYSGGDIKLSYEFYLPLAISRQLECGQLSPCPFFANLIRPREQVSNMEYIWVRDMAPNPSSLQLTQWQDFPFSSTHFESWWAEWSSHLFNHSVGRYLKKMDPKNADSYTEVPFKPLESCIYLIPLSLSGCCGNCSFIKPKQQTD